MIEKGTLCRIKEQARPDEVAGRLCEVTGPPTPCPGFGHDHLRYPIHVPSFPVCICACADALVPIVPPGNPDAEDRDIPVLIDQCTPPEELLK